MKFSTTAAFFALSSALLVSARPAGASFSVIAPTGIRTIDMGSPDLQAAVLDPTFEEGPNTDSSAAGTTSSAAQVDTAPPATVTAMAGGFRPISIKPVVKTSTPTSQAQVTSSPKPSSSSVAAVTAMGGGVRPINIGRPISISSSSKPASISTVTVTVYKSLPPVTVTLPGKTSTITSTRLYTPSPTAAKSSSSSAKPAAAASSSAAVSAAGAFKPILPNKAATVTQSSTKTYPTSFVTVTNAATGIEYVTSTIPGKTHTVTSYRQKAWATRPASAVNTPISGKISA